LLNRKLINNTNRLTVDDNLLLTSTVCKKFKKHYLTNTPEELCFQCKRALNNKFNEHRKQER